MNSLPKKFVIALPFLAHFMVAHGTLQRTFIPESIFAGILFVLLIAPFFFRKNLSARARIAIWPMLLPFFIYFCIANPLYSIYNGNNEDRVFVLLAAFGVVIIYTKILSDYSFNSQDSAQFLYWFIILGVVISIEIIINYLMGGATETGRSTGYLQGEEDQRTLTLPHLPIALSAAIPLAVAHPNRRVRAAFMIFSAILAIGIAMTVTRAMIIAVLLSGFASIFILQYIAKVGIFRSIMDVLIAMGAILVGLISFADNLIWVIDALAGRSFGNDTGDENTILGRFDEYTAAIDGFLDSPILGQGMGNLFWFPSQYDLQLSITGTPIPHSHIFFILGATGLIGGIIYYRIIIQAFHYIFLCIKSDDSKSVEFKVIATSFLSGFMGGFIFTLSSTTFVILGYSFFFAAFIYFSLLAKSRQNKSVFTLNPA